MYLVYSIFDFILLLPSKRCLIISHSKKIFQICSKFDHKLARLGRWQNWPNKFVSRIREKLKYVSFRHLFRGCSKIKSKIEKKHL